MATRIWGPGSGQGGGIVETSPWAIQALTRGARAGTDETFERTATDETTGVAAEEVASQLLVDSRTMLKAKTSTPTDQAQEGTSAQLLRLLVSKLTVSVRTNHASVVYEDAAPPLPLTKKATVVSDSQRMKHTQVAVGTAAEVAAATTDVDVNPVWIVGHTTAPTMIVRVALRVANVGRRTLSLLTLHQWAITIGQML
jgi:hypothetical protein